MANNNLSGTIPASLSNTSLLEIDFANNRFRGTVPPVFSGMHGLYYLNLEQNQFEARDASDLSFIDSLVNCSNLQVFSIAYNDLAGVLPSSIKPTSPYI